MVKRFRRSAAGYDEQLPSDIRTPQALKKTLDYLIDKIVGGYERLITVEKFVWDRTRGIRNDFSIQQVTKPEDVELAVDCFERIARFHILTLHVLSDPSSMEEDEHFDAQQEREQLNNTLMSLVYYYDDHVGQIDFPNEAEFRAYLILFELQNPTYPDLEDRVHLWDKHILNDRRVKTALQLYRAAGNPLPQGPLTPQGQPPVAQNNSGKFWDIMESKTVPFVMACVAELGFNYVRFAALDAIWQACKNAPSAQQNKSRDWTLPELTNFLGFDEEEDTRTFCESSGVPLTRDGTGIEYMDLSSNTAKALDRASNHVYQSFHERFLILA
jgi:nuclear mRNA export protein SAC3